MTGCGWEPFGADASGQEAAQRTRSQSAATGPLTAVNSPSATSRVLLPIYRTSERRPSLQRGSHPEPTSQYRLVMVQARWFSRMTISNWRQFETIDLDLTGQLTVLTGENGTGKTSLLSSLGGHFGYSGNLVGTPLRVGGKFFFVSGRSPYLSERDQEFEAFGELVYDSGDIAEIGVWPQSGPEFSIMFQNQQDVPGLMLDSHRVVSKYGEVESIPPRFKSAGEIVSEYRDQIFNWWQPWRERKSPALLMKESLVAAALYSEGNSAIVADPFAAEVWTGFQEVLRLLLPTSLNFRGLKIDQAEVIVETGGGDFALEAASGGASAIFDLAWQIYLQSRDFETFTVCIDEPENHLHPSLQRTILPNLLRAFPAVKFIVASHSPFVVTSSRESRVYVLRRDESGRVNSEELDLREQALSAEEVLREVLGVGSTLPMWAESEFDRIIAEFSAGPLTPESMQTLMHRLQDAGLRFSMPEVAASVADATNEMDS